MTRPLPVLVRCNNLVKDHRHAYTCLAHGGAICEVIARGPDLSACPDFASPLGLKMVSQQSPRAPAAQVLEEEDELAEHCPCAGPQQRQQ